jgi:hypothetical protein
VIVIAQKREENLQETAITSARNLTEEETWTSLERANEYGAITGQINEPRTWAIEVQYDF